MEEELKNIELILRDSAGEWQWNVAQIITQIPHGYLVTYKALAEYANSLFGYCLIARNIAWLRRRLYELLTHETQIPLHRIAKVRDINSLADSEITKRYNDRLRAHEGSLQNPIWWNPLLEA